MEMSIINIGNSKGVRIPKPLLQQCNIGDQVEISVENNSIILTPIHKRDYSLNFESIPEMNDMEVQLMLRDTDSTTLGIALSNADKALRKKIFKNMSERAKTILKKDISRYEKMDTKELMIEMHKAAITRSIQKVNNL